MDSQQDSDSQYDPRLGQVENAILETCAGVKNMRWPWIINHEQNSWTAALPLNLYKNTHEHQAFIKYSSQTAQRKSKSLSTASLIFLLELNT